MHFSDVNLILFSIKFQLNLPSVRPNLVNSDKINENKIFRFICLNKILEWKTISCYKYSLVFFFALQMTTLQKSLQILYSSQKPNIVFFCLAFCQTRAAVFTIKFNWISLAFRVLLILTHSCVWIFFYRKLRFFLRCSINLHT